MDSEKKPSDFIDDLFGMFVWCCIICVALFLINRYISRIDFVENILTNLSKKEGQNIQKSNTSKNRILNQPITITAEASETVDEKFFKLGLSESDNITLKRILSDPNSDWLNKEGSSCGVTSYSKCSWCGNSFAVEGKFTTLKTLLNDFAHGFGVILGGASHSYETAWLVADNDTKRKILEEICKHFNSGEMYSCEEDDSNNMYCSKKCQYEATHK